MQRRLAAARTEHEQTNLRRHVDATDWQIDRLVYDLYNLSEEGIRLARERKNCYQGGDSL